MKKSSNFVQGELLAHFIGTIWRFKGKQLRQSLLPLPKIDFSTHLNKFLVSWCHLLSLYYLFCVYSREICVGICFPLFCTKIYIYLPLQFTSALSNAFRRAFIPLHWYGHPHSGDHKKKCTFLYTGIFCYRLCFFFLTLSKIYFQVSKRTLFIVNHSHIWKACSLSRFYLINYHQHFLAVFCIRFLLTAAWSIML